VVFKHRNEIWRKFRASGKDETSQNIKNRNAVTAALHKARQDFKMKLAVLFRKTGK